MKLEDLAAPLDMTPVSVQNVKRIMPAWNKKFEDWGEQVEESIEKRISLEIEKIDPSMLASVRIDRRITGKSLSDGTYYPGQLLEVENTVRIVRIFDTPVTIYSPGDKETFIAASIDGVTFEGNKVTVPTNPRIEYFKFTSYIQLPGDIEDLGKTLEYELVAFTTHSIDVGSVFVTIASSLAPPGAVQDLDFGLLTGAANMAAKHPEYFTEWANKGEELTIYLNGIGDVKFRVVALNQYDTVSGGKCGLVLQSESVLTFNGVSGLYFPTDNSILNTYFPQAWQQAIVQVQVPKYQYAGTTYNKGNINCTVFLPSRAEIMGKQHGSYSSGWCLDDEGTQYPYWVNHNTASDRILNTVAGTPSSYWLRTNTASTGASGAAHSNEYGVINTTGELYPGSDIMSAPTPVSICICIGDSTV